MTSNPTCTCAKATPPGGTTATFIESCLAGTFLADMPILYWIPFQDRATGLPRMTKMPSEPSTCCWRSFESVVMGLLALNDVSFLSCFLLPASCLPGSI